MATPDIAVDRGLLNTAQGIFAPSPDQLNLITVLDGQISLDFGRQGFSSNRVGDSYVYLPDSPGAKLEWDSFGALAVRLPMAAVTQMAWELTGTGPDKLHFMSPNPLSAAHRRLWSQTAQMLWRELCAPDTSVTHPLVHRELLNLVSAAAVSVFPSSALIEKEFVGPGAVRPSAVRRAVAYIEDHASLPITVSDIANAAGTTPRAIRAGFRRQLSTTPTAYLRHVRLQAAHADLEAADPGMGVTVREIANRWGFGKPAAFAAQYSAAYGCPPSDTLRG